MSKMSVAPLAGGRRANVSGDGVRRAAAAPLRRAYVVEKDDERSVETARTARSKPLNLRKLGRDPLHERVYQHLQEAIIAAQFEPGQQLTSRLISSAMGTSTMPVRAALSRLAAEKTVTVLANGIAAIPVLTREQFLELVELRVMLEGMATAKAATLVTKKQMAKLRRLAIELANSAADNNASRYVRANQRFKFAIFEAANAPALVDLIKRVWLQIGPFMHYFGVNIHKQIHTDEYDAIIDALDRSDNDAARTAIERDIRGGAEYLLSIVEFSPR